MLKPDAPPNHSADSRPLQRRWEPRLSEQPPASLEALAESLDISPRLARILWRRGLRESSDMDVFLSPGLRHLASLSDWPGLDAAADILAEGLNRGESLAVWGDYDADGVTATAVLLEFFKNRGIKVPAYLPNRREEGYGLNIPGVESLAAQGVKLLITVDCGVADTKPVARARELGMTVVVTDHHLPKDTLPEAHAIVNPRLAECPCPDLAGVGVAFLLASALNKRLPGAAMDVRKLLDLVALGTLADVVELKGQNRILTKNGMLLIAEARRPGIAALKEVAGYNIASALGAGQVAFGLAPRINAAGRMDEARMALDLLLAEDLDQARPLAKQLDAMNTERRREEDSILEEALLQGGTHLQSQGLVLVGPHWHPGVIGIVASRIVEAYYRPTLVLCEENGDLKGSGRSTREVDLHQCLCRCAEHLERFGGHRQAAGLTLKPEKLEDLRAAFHDAVCEQIGPEPLQPRLTVEEELSFSEVDYTLVKELELLQPFGPGNPEPVFASPPVDVRGLRVFGKNHVALDLRDEAAGMTLRGKAFRQSDFLTRDLVGKQLRVAFTPKLDTYNGLASIEVLIKDWKLG